MKAESDSSSRSGAQAGEVRGRAQGGVDLQGTGERCARLAALADLSERFRSRFQGLRLMEWPAGVAITLRSLDQPGGIVCCSTGVALVSETTTGREA